MTRMVAARGNFDRPAQVAAVLAEESRHDVGLGCSAVIGILPNDDVVVDQRTENQRRVDLVGGARHEREAALGCGRLWRRRSNNVSRSNRG